MGQLRGGRHKEQRSTTQPIGNLMYRSIRPASRSIQVGNSVAGPSHFTGGFQHFEKYKPPFHYQAPRLAHAVDSEYDENNYWEAPRSDGIVWAGSEYDHDFTCSTQEQRDIQTLFECGVCMETLPEDYVTLLDPCGHKFCRVCIRNYVCSKLTDRCFPILCPVCMTGRQAQCDVGSA
jgi:hypothetical protein